MNWLRNYSFPEEPLPELSNHLNGVYTRIECTGMEEFLKVKLHANLGMLLNEKAASSETDCKFKVSYNEETRRWKMTYTRNNVSHSFVFDMPRPSKVSQDVNKVVEFPKIHEGMKGMQVARNKTGDSFIFSEKVNENGSITIRRTFSDNWMKMTQESSIKGRKVICREKFTKSSSEEVG